MKHFLIILAAIFGIITINKSTYAQGHHLIHYQGILKNNDGTPFNGNINLYFRLYTRPKSDQPIWSEVHKNIEISDGNYEVLLGSQNPIKLSFYKYYFEVKAEGLDTISPRIAIAGPGFNWRLSFLFAAYTIVWIAIFVYILSISHRQKKIIKELETLVKVKARQETAES